MVETNVVHLRDELEGRVLPRPVRVESVRRELIHMATIAETTLGPIKESQEFLSMIGNGVIAPAEIIQDTIYLTPDFMNRFLQRVVRSRDTDHNKLNALTTLEIVAEEVFKGQKTEYFFRKARQAKTRLILGFDK